MKPVQDRGYLFCEYCSSFYFPPESSDGVRVLGEASDLECPMCGETLVSASVGSAPAWHCGKCRGILMNQDAFAKVIVRLRAQASGPPDEPKPVNWEACERQVRCPSCRQLMYTHPYAGPANVVIDVCIDCAVIWLDYGELRAIIDAPGRDRGTRHTAS